LFDLTLGLFDKDEIRSIDRCRNLGKIPQRPRFLEQEQEQLPGFLLLHGIQ
jgi:hypothetical protein